MEITCPFYKVKTVKNDYINLKNSNYIQVDAEMMAKGTIKMVNFER